MFLKMQVEPARLPFQLQMQKRERPSGAVQLGPSRSYKSIPLIKRVCPVVLLVDVDP